MERIKKEYPEPNEYFHFEVFQWIKNASAEDLFKGMDIAYPDALIKFRLKEVDDGCTFTAKYKWSRKDLWNISALIIVFNFYCVNGSN